MRYAAVVIGRNEGVRLKRCVASVRTAEIVVYVDSGSSDGSADWARTQGVEVVELDTSVPFTAARARNAGFERLGHLASTPEFVEFVDADCEIDANWPAEAI